jgi:hypothetical protein
MRLCRVGSKDAPEFKGRPERTSTSFTLSAGVRNYLRIPATKPTAPFTP